MTKKIISLFSGADGIDIGFHQAGFETAVAVEQDPSCCATLRRNMPNVTVIEGDINKISTQEILQAGNLKPLEPALVVGGHHAKVLVLLVNAWAWMMPEENWFWNILE